MTFAKEWVDGKEDLSKFEKRHFQSTVKISFPPTFPVLNFTEASLHFPE